MSCPPGSRSPTPTPAPTNSSCCRPQARRRRFHPTLTPTPPRHPQALLKPTTPRQSSQPPATPASPKRHASTRTNLPPPVTYKQPSKNRLPLADQTDAFARASRSASPHALGLDRVQLDRRTSPRDDHDLADPPSVSESFRLGNPQPVGKAAPHDTSRHPGPPYRLAFWHHQQPTIASTDAHREDHPCWEPKHLSWADETRRDEPRRSRIANQRSRRRQAPRYSSTSAPRRWRTEAAATASRPVRLRNANAVIVSPRGLRGDNR